MRHTARSRTVAIAAAALASLATRALAAPPAVAPMVTAAVDDGDVVALTGDLSRARTTDAGALAAGTRIANVRLTLKRPAVLQQALDTLVAAQQQKGSPHYHQWLRAADLRGYGPAAADIAAVAGWLGRHGLAVTRVAASGMTIQFSGTAANIARAFGTPLRHVTWKGEGHIANAAAPAIPRALRDVVAGVTLNDFHPRPLVRRAPNLTTTSPVSGNTYYAVSPQDFDTIYGVKPLQGSHNQFGQAITGAGVTIAVVEDTDILPRDFDHFREAFGLSGYAGTLSQIHPGCHNPGRNGDEVEAALDMEWAGVAAPDANIVEATCAADDGLLSGIEDAMAGLVEGSSTPDVISVSYGLPITLTGYGFEAAWANLTEEAAAEGISVLVASGDAGTSADRNQIDGEGLDVEATSGTPNNLSVGGTDFQDTVLGESGEYWRPHNGPNFESALSYVPETVWNDSCANPLLAAASGYSSPLAACNAATPPGAPGVGGSGGRNPLYAKPSWQRGVPGMLADGVRDEPDVSLFAADGVFRHFLLLCFSDRSEGGSACEYGKFETLKYQAAGGTSFAAPAFAGVVALMLEAGGTRIGNPAPILYSLASGQYATHTGLSGCNASLGNKIGAACAFYNVTTGSNAEPCYAGSPDCGAGPHAADNGIGILVDPLTHRDAYLANPGYTPATGLGSVNVTNLIYQYIINGS